MSSLQRLALRDAARRAGVSLRTVGNWRAEGMRVEKREGRLTVRVDHLLAWKRWKALVNPAMGLRRGAAVRRGEVGAEVSPREFERARREWVAAGGRTSGEGVV